MAFCWFLLKVSCLGQTAPSGGWSKWGTGNSGSELGFAEDCSVALSPLFFGETNLWLLLAMVAGDQVNNDAGPQGGSERAPVIGHSGLLQHYHLQQDHTKS